MKKNSTLYLISLYSEKNHLQNTLEMSPSNEIVKKILQFAASHRVEKVPENNLVDYYLN